MALGLRDLAVRRSFRSRWKNKGLLGVSIEAFFCVELAEVPLSINSINGPTGKKVKAKDMLNKLLPHCCSGKENDKRYPWSPMTAV